MYEFMSVPLHLVGAQAANGIIYSPHAIEIAVTRFKQKIALGCARCELGMPKKSNSETMREYIVRCGQIDESNVCARIDDIDITETAVIGTVTFTGPHKEIGRELFTSGQACFGMRGFASVGPDNVGTNLSLVSFDLVADNKATST